jgi:ferrous iron transport protein B
LAGRSATRRIDDVVLHPVFGLAILALILFVMFQAVFAWAETPMNLIDAGVAALSDRVSTLLPESWIKSLVVDGIIAGVGSVVIFLPQIIILFAFILALEQSGYMTRAAFLMDQLMAKVGLNGRAFIPLLSSFACAIPGIMATRSIDNPRDRLTTIMIAPLMTCSARLPVYAVIIAAFIPASKVGGVFGLQGLVLFGLYLAGIISAFVVALVLRRTLTKGAAQPFLMEMPQYQLPILRDLLIGLYQRAMIFLKRAGTIILASMIILWLFSSFPLDSVGARPPLNQSLTGKIGDVLEPVFAPIGFNREIAIALVPGMAAREVAVGALGQVYALSGSDEVVAGGLVNILRRAWSLPTALAFLAWYVFAPQCISTIAVTRRETNGWRWPLFMLGYLFVLAYGATGATYWLAKALLT